MAVPPALARLVDALKRLPGVGTRTAERLAFHLLRAPHDETHELAEALLALQDAVVACSTCHNLAESDPCSLCSDPDREHARLLVVEQPRDVTAFEEAGWKGLYHVLLGHVSPLEGVEAKDLTLSALVDRVSGGSVSEVIVATNPDYEGDATALHIVRALDGQPVQVSRIARGVASGSAIEYSNSAMLSDALAGRVNLEGGGR
ncbi:MAG: recombination protein RecR [Planctomycetota bacterium]|nr:MAG: recombination protein RecR [Planctomycetota bacterium]